MGSAKHCLGIKKTFFHKKGKDTNAFAFGAIIAQTGCPHMESNLSRANIG